MAGVAKTKAELKAGDFCIVQDTCQRGCCVEGTRVALIQEVCGDGESGGIWAFEYYKDDRGKWRSASGTRSYTGFHDVLTLRPDDEVPYASTVGEVG